MDDVTLIADLVRAGVADELVNRVITALTNVRDSPGHVRDIVRAYETGRKRKQRENADKSSGKQTMSARSSETKKQDVVRDSASERCNTSFLSSSSSSEVKRSKEKKEEQASKRGTRLLVGAPMPAEFLEWAIAQGASSEISKKIWIEFVDFWSAVPGQRGLKLDWFATFRNRVRQVWQRHRGIKNGAGNRVMEAFDYAIDRAAGGEVESDPPMRDITPRRP